MLEGLFGAEEEESALPSTQDYVPFRGKNTKLPRPPAPREKLGFVGLDNQGATCYLNSLIQCMFMTPELRSGLFAVDPVELGVDQTQEAEDTEKNAPTVEEPVDDNLLQMLIAIGVDESRARVACRAVKTGSVEEAFDYLERMDRAAETATTIAAQASKPAATDSGNGVGAVKSAKPKKVKVRSIPLELQRLFSEMQLLDQATLSTQDLTRKGFQWQGYDGQVQHDAHELNRLLIDALERSLRKTSGEKLCQRLYEGKIENQILCTGCNSLSVREESFYDLNLQVQDCRSAAEALHHYCQCEILSGDSAYQCDRCAKKTTAYRATKLKLLPNVLSLSCNRFKIDASTQWQRVKISSECKYPVLMDVTAFCGYNVVSVAQGIAYPAMSELESHMLYIDDLFSAAKALANEKVNEAARSDQQQLLTWSIQELKQFAEEILLPWTQREQLYLLHGIIIHRGSAYSGHYYAYIRDHLQESRLAVEEYMDTFAEQYNSNTSHASNGKAVIEYFVSNDGVVYISTGTVLFDVVQIFQSQEEVYHASKRRKNKPFSLTISILSREFAQRKKGSWANLCKAQLGSIENYLRAHNALFTEISTGCFAISADARHQFISQDEMDILRVSKLQVAENEAKEDGEKGNEDLNNHVDTTNDEAVAKALQEQEDGVISNQEEWQVAKPRKKGKSASKATDKSSTDSTAAETSELLKEASNHRDLLVQQLTETLLHRVMGNYYEFNDSKVTPVSYHKLQQAFEGVNSAYLLVYRRVGSEDIQRMAIGSSLSSTPAAKPQVPGYWAEKVNQRNDQLHRDRQMYDESLRKLKLSIYTQDQMFYSTPLFMTQQAAICVEMDGKKTVSDLMDEVILKVNDTSREFWRTHDRSCWRLSKLDRFGEGLFPLDVLPSDAIIVDHIASQDQLLLWIEDRHSVEPVICGEENKPVVVHFNVLEPNTLAAKAKEPRNMLCPVKVRGGVHVEYLPGTWTIMQTMYFLSHKHQIDALHAIVHVELHVSSRQTNGHAVSAGNAVSAAADHHSGDGEKNGALTCIFHRGVSKLSGGDPGANVLLKNIASRWKQMYMEDCESAGMMNKQALAVQYTQYRQNIVRVDIEVEKEVQVLWREQANGKVMESIVQLEVHKQITIQTMKQEIYKALVIDGVLSLDVTRLRMSSLPGEGVLDDESQSLADIIGSRSSFKLYLEHGSVKSNATLKLEIALVNGNSTEARYTTKQSGIRLESRQIEVDTALTVQQLRDLVAHELLGFPKGWTAKEHDILALQQWIATALPDFDVQARNSFITLLLKLLLPPCLVFNWALAAFKGRRLRRTSWTKEFAELLMETDRNGHNLCVKDCNLRDHDLLLLEEGKPLVKGQVMLPVYLWKADFEESQAAEVVSSATESEDVSHRAEAAYQRREQSVALIGHLTILLSMTLLDLQRSIYDMFLTSEATLPLQETLLGKGLWPLHDEQFLVRDLRADLLPGRIYWLSSAEAPGQSTAAWSAVGAKQTASKDGSGAVNSLQRLGFKAERGVVIHLLPESQRQRASHRSAGAFDVWVQMLANPATARKGTAAVQPAWPPVSVTIQGGVAPSLGHFFRPISQLFSPLTFETFGLLRYYLPTHEWQEVNPAKAKNLCQGPYFLKEGDHFLVYNKSKVCQIISLDACLAEDLHFRQLREQSRAEKAKAMEENKSRRKKKVSYGFVLDDLDVAIGGHTSGKKPARPERALVLGGDYDNWDEEEQGDAEEVVADAETR